MPKGEIVFVRSKRGRLEKLPTGQKCVTRTISCSDDFWRRVQAAAEGEGMSASGLLVKLFTEWEGVQK